jgi:hypothetical protein
MLRKDVDNGRDEVVQLAVSCRYTSLAIQARGCISDLRPGSRERAVRCRMVLHKGRLGAHAVVA